MSLSVSACSSHLQQVGLTNRPGACVPQMGVTTPLCVYNPHLLCCSSETVCTVFLYCCQYGHFVHTTMPIVPQGWDTTRLIWIASLWLSAEHVVCEQREGKRTRTAPDYLAACCHQRCVQVCVMYI